MSLQIELYIDVDTGGDDLHRVQLHFDSISHNFIPLWKKLSVYDSLYKSNDYPCGQISGNLNIALRKMTDDSERFMDILPKSNLFGDDYDTAVTFLAALASVCEVHPNALISISL